MPKPQVYAIGYSSGRPKPCNRTDCLEGGQLLHGQLRFSFVRLRERDGREFLYWRHLSCASDAQKKRLPQKLSSPAEIRGYDSLGPDDQRRVIELFGWNEEASTRSPESEGSFTNDAQEVYDPSGLFSVDIEQDSNIQPHSPKTTVLSFNIKSNIEGGRENNQGDDDMGVELRSASKETGRATSNLSKQPQLNAKAPPEPTSSLLMHLELEEKEGRVRLAEAELKVAEARATVEAARYSVIEHKLKMLHAGIIS